MSEHVDEYERVYYYNNMNGRITGSNYPQSTFPPSEKLEELLLRKILSPSFEELTITSY